MVASGWLAAVALERFNCNIKLCHFGGAVSHELPENSFHKMYFQIETRIKFIRADEDTHIHVGAPRRNANAFDQMLVK